MGTLGTQGQTMNLADVNALSTLGGQQQQIGQNAQNYPLTTLSSLSNIMQGAQIPTTVTSQLNASPLSTLAGMGTGALGMIQPYTGAVAGSGSPRNAWESIQQLLGSQVNQPVDTTTPTTSTGSPEGSSTTYTGTGSGDGSVPYDTGTDFQPSYDPLALTD